MSYESLSISEIDMKGEKEEEEEEVELDYKTCCQVSKPFGLCLLSVFCILSLFSSVRSYRRTWSERRPSGRQLFPSCKSKSSTWSEKTRSFTRRTIASS